MDQTPFMYTDMTERDLLRWVLDYTMPWVIETFEAIPDDCLAVRPRPHINAPGWIFGHIAVTERVHVGHALEGADDVPGSFAVFRSAAPIEEETRQAIESKASLVDYWREVRAKTRTYLDRISDEDLKEIPAHSLLTHEDNRYNPVREWFVMTIQHQNLHWGELEIIGKLIASDRAGA